MLKVAFSLTHQLIEVVAKLSNLFQHLPVAHTNSPTTAPLVKLQAEIFTFRKINGSDLNILISCSFIFFMVYLIHIEQLTIQMIKFLWN